MKRKDEHINKYLHDALPEPEIPADDAWAQMNDMLYPNSVGTSQSVAGKLASYVSQFKWPLLTALGGVSLSLLVILGPDSETSTGNAKKEQLTIDSLKTTEAKPDHAVEEYGKRGSKAGNANVAREQEKNDISEKADHISKAISTNDHTVSKNKEEIAINDEHVNASYSSEKRISNIKKKPDPGAKSGNAEIRQSVGNGEIPARNLVRSGKTTGSSNDIGSEIGNGSISDNRVRGTSGSGNNTVTFNTTKENNVPGLLNPAAIIPSVSENLIHSLQSLPFHYTAFNADLRKKINTPKNPAPAQTSENKKTRSLPIHFGLEWNLNTPLQHTNYLFTGTDSISRPARLLIPGIFISRKWANHTVSFSFSAYQPYFGNNKRVQQLSDTTGGGDSVKIYSNSNLIKATGMNFTLQYQYQVIGPLLLNAGLSYSTFSSALIRKETENRFGELLKGPLVTVKKSGDLRSYLNPGFFALKAGLAVHPAVWQGRIQAGSNIILPLSNVSSSTENPVRALNGQVYLRIMLR